MLLPVADRVLTDRLTLRCWEAADAPAVRASLDRSDSHLRPWIPFMRNEPRTLEGTVEWIETRRRWFECGEHAPFGVFARDTSELVGEAMLLDRAGTRALEIGYWIDVDRIGLGYGSEATAALIRVAFELAHVDFIELCCGTGNSGSIAIANKLNFTHDGTLRGRNLDCDGNRNDLRVYSLFAHEYPTSHAHSVGATAYTRDGAEHLLA